MRTELRVGLGERPHELAYRGLEHPEQLRQSLVPRGEARDRASRSCAGSTCPPRDTSVGTS